MVAEEMRGAPTPFEELMFIDRIYKTKGALHETLKERGFEYYAEIELPRVDCFMYLPATFPKNREEAAKFDFASLTNQRVAIGVCVGGTYLTNCWDEKVRLGVQGILKINHNCSIADKAATQIFLAVDDFFRDFAELRKHNVSLDVHICGYSLGGLFAQVTTVLLQDWASTTRNRVTCRTFESPGIPEMYHEISQNYTTDPEQFWKQRITNFKSLPNPLNTVFQDLGRVFHLKNTDHINCSTSWVIKCVAGTAKRLAFWTGLMKGFGIGSDKESFNSMTEFQQKCTIGAAIALELGMDLCEVVRNHDVALMLGCFDQKSGTLLSSCCIEMEQWPVYENFEDSAVRLLQSVSQGLMVMDPRNAGLHTLFLFGGKRGFVERKLRRIPGYLPMPIKAKAEQPATTMVEA